MTDIFSDSERLWRAAKFLAAVIVASVTLTAAGISFYDLPEKVSDNAMATQANLESIQKNARSIAAIDDDIQVMIEEQDQKHREVVCLLKSLRTGSPYEDCSLDQ